MSVQAMTWVIENSKHKGSAFVVLLMIANHAHADGTGSYAAVDTLAKEARITPRQVFNLLLGLERSKELSIERGAGPRGTNLCTVMMCQENLPLKSFHPEKHRQQISPEPSGTKSLKPKPPIVPLAGGQTKNSSNEESFMRTGQEWIAIRMGNRKRLFSRNEWSGMVGIQAKYLLERIRARGFEARLVPAEEVETWPKRKLA
jgi:hypothetical protein